MIKLKPCPFCGSTQLVFNWDITSVENGYGQISCKCGAKVRKNGIPEHYEQITDDIYRKIPAKQGKELAVEVWNGRAE